MRPWAVPVAAIGLSLCLIAEQLPIRSYSTADGLAADGINKIVVDSRGFTWFCTPEGLSRFDGYRFVNFGVAEGLPDPSVNALLETRAGEYLVGTSRGLCAFRAGERGKFTTYLPGGNEAENAVNALMEGSDGRIWCGTSAGLFEILGGHRFRRQPLPAPAPGQKRISISDLEEGAGHKLWVATRSGIYIVGKEGDVQHIALGGPTNNVRALLRDHSGRVWAGTQAGLVLMRDADKAGKDGVDQIYRKVGRVSLDVTSLADGPNGAIWAGASGGIVRWFPDNLPPAFGLLTRTQGLIDRQVHALARDRAGNMWAATEAAGVMKIQPAGFTTFGDQDGLDSDRVWSVVADRTGTVLAVTSSERNKDVVNVFDGAKFHPVSLKGFSDRPPWGHHILLQARAGAWWAATGAGLCTYAPVQAAALAAVRPQACYARDTVVFQIFEDSKGGIWASQQFLSGKPRVMRWDPGTNAVTFMPGGPDGYELVAAFAEDREGKVWMGTGDGDLFRYNGREFTRFQRTDGVLTGAVRELFVDSAGRLWIASLSGLGLIEKPGSPHFTMRIYRTSDGLASDTTFSITEDTAGRIYAANAKGVDRLDPRTGRVKRFSAADGLARGVITAALRDGAGDLWFATTQGLSRLSPTADVPPTVPSVRITELRVGRERYPISQVGETRIGRGDLQPSQNQFQVAFAGFSNEPEANLRYAYKLEGGESAWQAPGRDHEANYPGLPEGHYRFLVKALNSEGQESATPAEIDFVILPPVWRRWWFEVMAFLAFVAALYSAYRYNLDRRLELERVRTRIATDLHDDIGSSLSGMALLSEAVKQQLGTARPEAFEMASEVAVMARGLARGLSDVVWSVDPRRDDLRSVTTRVRQFAAMLESQGIAWSLQEPPEPQKVKLTPEQRHHLYLIFKEALNNIARHAHCASASLRIEVEDRQLRAEIVDDGCGFPGPDGGGSGLEEHPGNGLRNMKLRAAQLGGCMSVHAAAGRGVRLELTVPLK
jgi:ligand-binding sensor domain-containing protein/signal transduction histidine kinase